MVASLGDRARMSMVRAYQNTSYGVMQNLLQSSIVDAAVLADIYGESTSDWHTMDSAKLRAEEITRNRN